MLAPNVVRVSPCDTLDIVKILCCGIDFSVTEVECCEMFLNVEKSDAGLSLMLRGIQRSLVRILCCEILLNVEKIL